MITEQQLHKIFMVTRASIIEEFLPHLQAVMAKYEITTKQRIACFLAQVGHESGALRYTKEIASGAAYEGRKDLGNTSPGDGVKYKGRGLIQITGKANYESFDKFMGANGNIVDNPGIVEVNPLATEVAGWFWHIKGLNELADKGEFDLITRRINGGLNGLEDRKIYYRRALSVL